MKKQLPLKKQVEDNTTVTRKVAGRYGGEYTEKAGTPLDHATKHVNENKRLAERPIVGISKGVTLNQGDYQSLRVDCWLTDIVKEHETIDDAFQRVGALVDEQLEIQVETSR